VHIILLVLSLDGMGWVRVGAYMTCINHSLNFNLDQMS
jgi:hypothetical protein